MEAEARNTGKPLGPTASEEIPPMVDQIRFVAGAARMLEGRASAEYMRGFQSTIRREPVGVVGSVAPWNYPMMMAVWKCAPALAAGNTIVLEPSDTTPASAVLMAELFSDILPPGITAATRVIVDESIRGELVEALAEQAAAVRLSRDEVRGSEDLHIPPVNNP
ncbi:aldehyde dehydrogenase family protein, partial [Pseudonocardia oceani]|uniref:aldehyde dehydrogenase family protein n=1 Tax=Pseudonocardia oceani TaxID=2792013 RepID=UPI0027E30393